MQDCAQCATSDAVATAKIDAYASASTITKPRGRYGSLKRHRGEDDPETIAARQELAVANIEAAVARILAKAPALTSEQVARVRSLLPTPISEPDQAIPA